MAGKRRANKKDDNAEYMSAEELKSRFYEYFRDSGTFADLRSQLRSKLVNEMFKASPDSNEADSKDDSESSMLPLQVGNWFVYDHLNRLGLEYSLSTFVSEANLPYPKKVLSLKDILHVFGIDSSLPEYEFIHSAYMNKKPGESFLYTFINIITKKTFTEISRDSPPKAELTRKKKSFPLSDLNPSEVFNETFNDLEPSFKETASNIETVMYKQLQLEKDKHEKEIQQLRQKLLLELDTLYTHEQQVRVELEQRKIKLVHEQEVLDLQKEKFKMKEVELNGRLNGLELEAGEKVKALKETLSLKLKEVDAKESQLNESQRRLEKHLAELKAKDIQSETFEAKFIQLQNSYKTLQNEYTASLNENERLQIELKRVSDYSIIKEELGWKSKKLEHFEKELVLLRMQLHEERSSSLHAIQKLQQQMMTEMSMSHLMSQYITTMQMDQLANNKEKSSDQGRKSSQQQHEELLTRIEDQRQDIQELHRLIHNLHYQPPTKQDYAACVESSPTNEPAPMSPKSSPNRKPLHQSSSNQKLYEETNQRIQDLIKETDVMEQKYLEYMCGRPTLCPNVYIPYSPAQFHLDVQTPFAKDNLPFQYFGNSFKNFDLEFTSKPCDPKFVKPSAKISTDQKHTNYAQNFFELLRSDGTSSQSYGAMPAQAYDAIENKSKFLSTNQAFSSNLPSLQSKEGFALDKTVEKKLFMNGQNPAPSGVFEIEKVTHNDVLNGNTSNFSEHAINRLQNEYQRFHMISQTPTVTDQNPNMNFTSSEQTAVNNKVECGSGDKTSLSEKNDANTSNNERNLNDKRDNISESVLKTSDAQTIGDTTFKLDNSVFNRGKLASDNTFLEPLVTNKKVGGAVSDDLPIDLDAVWKQQTKTSIFKINTKNVYTVSSNETELPSVKHSGHSENKTRQKSVFDGISKPSTSSSSVLEKDVTILNPSLEKNTAQLNSVPTKGMRQNSTSGPEKDLTLLDSISEKDILPLDATQSNPTSEKDVLPLNALQMNPTPERDVLTLNATQLNPISEKDALPLNATQSNPISEKDALPLNATQSNPTSEKEVLPLNATQLNPTSEKDVLPLNATQSNSTSEKEVLPLNATQSNPTSEKGVLPLNAPRSNLIYEKDTSIFSLEPKSVQKSDFSQETSKKPNTDNDVQLNKQKTSKSISSEQSTPGLETIPSKGSKHSVDTKLESKKNGSSLHSSHHTLEVRNSVSEISSSELDEKDSNNPNDSELNLSAGSELEQAKVDEDDDGW